MTEEQKMQFMMALAQSGANISQINFGDGTQNFYLGKEGSVMPKEDDVEVVDAEIIVPDAETSSPTHADHECSALKPYIVNQQRAGQLIRWMHQRIDTLTRPKMKLQVVRALYEGGYFTALLPHAVYCQEFGQMPASTYSEWMGATLKYSTTEMDSVLGDLLEDIQ